MHFNAGPWAGLLRASSTRGLFLLGGALLGGAAGGFYLLFAIGIDGEVRRALGQLLAIAGGIGLAALLLGIFRLVMAGGRVVRGLAAASLLIGAVSGGVVWYSVSVAQPRARGACWSAARGYSPEERAARLAEGKARMASVFFRIAERWRSDPSIAQDCASAETDEARRMPTPAARSADVLAALGAPAASSAAPPESNPWPARLGIEDLVSAELIRLDRSPALHVTLRGAAPDDLEAIRERCRALYPKAAPFIGQGRDPLGLDGLDGSHVALVVSYEEGEARGITLHDAALGKVVTVVEGAGVSLQDRAAYALELNPTTEVTFTPDTNVTCKGTALNLGDSPLDLVVECQPEELGTDQRPAKIKPPVDKLVLRPHGKGTYEVHPWKSRATLVRHVVHERGKEDGPPIESFNRFAYDHGKAWLALHDRLRKSTGVRFHNPYSSLAPSHRDTTQPDLALPAGWDELDAKQREAAAKEIWKAMAGHYQKWHSWAVTTVHLHAGGAERWQIEGGKLKKVEAK